MVISTFLDLSQMPARTQDQVTFDKLEGAFRQKLPTWGAEVNATAADINTALATATATINTTLTAANSLAAGGGMSIPLNFDTATADVDPTAGKLRLNNATQNLATVIRVDLLGSDGLDYTGILDTFDASTSPTVKGTLTLRKQGDPKKFLTFNLTARATPAGYRNLTVVCIGSSAANPFAVNDPIVVQFSRTGDQGVQGVSYLMLRVREEYASGTAAPASVAGVSTRVMNTTKSNTIPGASVAGNQFTLPAGQYEVAATAPAYNTNGHHAYWYCVTDATVVVLGTSENSGGTSFARSLVAGEFTVPAGTPKVYELRHATASGTGNLGYPATIAGQSEVYAETAIKKLS